MQLSVALGLHFGRGSQLNTREMVWIDNSRWMISSRCSWISVYLFWRTTHAFEPLPFFVADLALRCVFNPVNCPAVICLPRIVVLSSFGRETSLVNITGLRSIFSSLFTRLFTFLLLLSSCYHYHYPLCLILCKKRPERLTTSLNFVGSKVICVVCRSRPRNQLCLIRCHCSLATYFSLPESYGRQIL